MIENRILSAVRVNLKSWVNYTYATMAPLLVVFIIGIGQVIGLALSELIPTEWLQKAYFVIDPMFIQLLMFLFPASILFLWVSSVEHRSIVGLGFFKQKWFAELCKGLGLGGLMISTIILLEVMTGSTRFVATYFSWENMMSFALILPCWLIQSGTEEVLLRGWLFPTVSQRTNLALGVIVSSLLFAILHLLNPSVSVIATLNIALFGLFACLYVLKTDNIWGIAGMHAAWNCFQGSFFGRPVSGMNPTYSLMYFESEKVPTFLSGGGFGPEGEIFSSLVLLVGIAYLVWDLSKNKKKMTL